MSSLICSEVRRESRNGKEYVVVIASQDQSHGLRAVPVDASDLVRARAALKARGLVLGGHLPVSSQYAENGPSYPSATFHLSASDDRGVKHCLIAEDFEELSLSAGSILFRLYIRAGGATFDWLVGRTIEVEAEHPATESADAIKSPTVRDLGQERMNRKGK